ncbi:MAG: FAD-dependent oxidoreductase [Hyphomicrobiales bacterium]|nr:FAD-dependent oxidoreductase [Hyphomicrobiales bacterium]
MPRDRRHDILFEPISIGPKTLKNRFFQVPQCTGAGNSRPGASAMHREVKAEGGWAALCTESCMIDPETDQPVATVSTLYDQDDVTNHRHMTDSVHKWGALAGVELCHAGGLANALSTRGVSPSAHQFATPWIPQAHTYEAEDSDFIRTIALYAEAARRAIDAGFDILYIHGTHGALPVQMLSPFHNRRTDRWGGSFENRARFWIAVLEAVRTVADGQCAVANRFSIDQLSGSAGVEVKEDGLRFVEHVTKLGLVDLWDINISSLQEWGEDAAPSRFQKSNHQMPWTSEVRSIAKVPVVGVGRFTDPDEMVRVIQTGQLDIIGCARPSIADPWLPRKVDEGRLDDIAECIGCNQCIARFEYGVTIVCTQNPTALEEYRRGWHPEKFAPRTDDDLVLVVGAGPAGLECARVLARRGYLTHLVEADLTMGGHLRDVVKLPGLAEWGRVVSLRETQLRRMPNVKIMMGTGAATTDDLIGYGADRIVLATGAHWVGDGTGSMGPDPIPGVDSSLPEFVTPHQFFSGKEIGERAVVLDSDGYFMAVSLAEKLADSGRQVTLVTPFDRVAPYTDLTLEGANLRRMMREKNIGFRVANWLERAEISGAIQLSVFDLYRDGSMRSKSPVAGSIPRAASTDVSLIECDSVLLCTGRRSNDALYRSLQARNAEWADAGLKGVYRAGDCLAPRYIADVVFDGHRMGREICSPDPQRPRAIIREQRIWSQHV